LVTRALVVGVFVSKASVAERFRQMVPRRPLALFCLMCLRASRRCRPSRRSRVFLAGRHGNPVPRQLRLFRPRLLIKRLLLKRLCIQYRVPRQSRVASFTSVPEYRLRPRRVFVRVASVKFALVGPRL
jgi:hypothetical protein